MGEDFSDSDESLYEYSIIAKEKLVSPPQMSSQLEEGIDIVSNQNLVSDLQVCVRVEPNKTLLNRFLELRAYMSANFVTGGMSDSLDDLSVTEQVDEISSEEKLWETHQVVITRNNGSMLSMDTQEKVNVAERSDGETFDTNSEILR